MFEIWSEFPPVLRFGFVLAGLVVVFGIGMVLRNGGKPKSKVYPVEVCDRHIARLRARLDRHIDAHSSTGFPER